MREEKMRVALILSLLLMGIGHIYARDSKSAEVDINVDGTCVPTYKHKGKTYIEAIKEKEYSIRISNPLGERVAVALSVDGLNTIDAKQTPAPKAAKWILEPYQSIVISGWQVSDRQARQFFFTTEDKSYGAKIGKTENFGLISAAFFKERRPQVYRQTYPPRPQYPPSYPPYPPYPIPWPGMLGGAMGGMGGSTGGLGAGMGGLGAGMGGLGGGMGGLGGGMGSMGSGMGGSGAMAGAPKTATPDSGSIRRVAPEAGVDKEKSRTAAPEFAATGMGNRVEHEVERVNMNLEDKPFATINLRYEFRPVLVKLGVPLNRPIEKDPLLRREKTKGFSNGQYSPEP
jgi:hypothetical protein